MIELRMPLTRPSAIHRYSPAAVTISAARNFELMPPIENSELSVSPAMALTVSSSDSTTLIRSPSTPSTRSRNPCSVVRMMVSCESVSDASIPASVSLSPNFSSSTETGSFSFTIGSTPFSHSALMQFITFRYRLRLRRSSAVSSSWAVLKFRLPHSSS